MTERERLVRLIDNGPAHFCDICRESPEERAESVEKLTDHLIASNVVSVVRCNDCDYSTVIRNSGDGSATWHCTKSYGLPEVDPMDYCSHGERREGNV
jgi:hypothetical protein